MLQASRVRRLFLFATAALLCAPAIAAACTCLSQPCGSVIESANLFEGTVESVGAAGIDGVVVRFSDVRAVRGAAPDFVTTAADGGSCGYDFVVGQRYLVDAHSRSSGRFGVSLCSNTRLLASAQGMLALLAAPPDARRRAFGRVATTALDTVGLARQSPIPGATVRLSGPVARTATTSENGDFTFTALPDGTYQFDVTLPQARRDVRAPASATVTLGSFDLCASIDLIAPSAAQVSGMVVDAAGAPIADVRVELFPWPYNQWAGGRVTAAVTDAGGRYAIDRLPPGRYAGGLGIPYPSPANAVAPALLRASDGGVVLTIEPGAALVMAPLVAVTAPLVRVSGRVSAPPGVPVADVELVLHPLDGFATARAYGGRPGADGRFEIRAHRGVRYRVVAEASQRVIGQAEFVAGDGDIVIALRTPR